MMGDGAAIENMADGVFEIATDSALYYYRGDPCTFKNGPNARFIRSGGSGALAVYLVAFTNEGFVELLTGLLDFGAGAYLQTNGATLLRGGEIKSSSLIDIRGGTLEGYGTVIGNVLSSSHVSPGYPGSTTIPQAPPGRRPAGSPPEPGILTINGNYTQTSTGVLRLNILGNILAPVLAGIDPSLALVGSLGSLAGTVMFFVFAIGMLLELKAYTQDSSFNWWFLFIPCLNIYLMLVLVPQQVTKAKQMARCANPTRGIVVFLFLFLYALAADLNDIGSSPG